MSERRTALVVTSAGVSSRFSRSLGREAVKCLYSEGGPQDTILHRQLAAANEIGLGPIVVVGGYRFGEVEDFCGRHLAWVPGLELVENARFATTGTLYSLHLGLAAVLGHDVDAVIFAEGDLLFDLDSFRAVATSSKSVVSACAEPITAERSVALYFTPAGHVRYVYDPDHRQLVIPEPFLSIHNSGQVWKFHDLDLLRALSGAVGRDRFDETNLGFIQEYFRTVAPDDVELVMFKQWFNCNTITDYRDAMAHLRGR
jgi:CTP:molybdopterin cytidylyltransferase MocA